MPSVAELCLRDISLDWLIVFCHCAVLYEDNLLKFSSI